MTDKLHISVSPHIHAHTSVQKIMLDVVIALLPATIAGVIIFGLRALLIIGIAVATCVLSEFLFNLITKKEQSVTDLSAIVTGLLLALNVPANIPIWQVIVGSVFAIVIVKCFFGGMGCNLVNPAITARVFMLIAFGSMATVAVPVAFDAVAGATPLTDLANGTAPNLLDLFIGKCSGSIGETCKIALLLGGVYLLARRVITWHIPVAYIGTAFVFSFLINGLADGFNMETLVVSTAAILSGGLIIGAIFMATDYVTSPATPMGKLVFGILAGIVTVMIRKWGVYPEGVSFAILLMNIINPYIDIWTARRVFGGKKA